RPRSAAPAGKSCAQPEHRLPVDLADARLAHAEHRADLLQVQLLFVVQRHHQLLAFGQAADRLGQVLAHALALDVLRRPEAALVGHVHHAALVAVVRPGEAEQPHAGGIGQHLVVFLGADAQPPHHLLLVRLRTRLDLDLADHLRHLAGLAMDRARRPVGASQLVQHRATDADARIRFEARPAVLGEIARRFQQTDHSRLDQVAHVHAGRQPPHQVIGDPPHQRCMPAYQFVGTFAGNLQILRSHTHLGTPSAVAFRPPKKAIRSNTARSVSAHLSTSSANFLNASAEWLDGHTSTTAHCLRMAWRRRSSCGTHPLKSITTSRKRSLTRASFWCSARASPSLRTMLATMRMRRTPKSRLSTLVSPYASVSEAGSSHTTRITSEAAAANIVTLSDRPAAVSTSRYSGGRASSSKARMIAASSLLPSCASRRAPEPAGTTCRPQAAGSSSSCSVHSPSSRWPMWRDGARPSITSTLASPVSASSSITSRPAPASATPRFRS